MHAHILALMIICANLHKHTHSQAASHAASSGLAVVDPKLRLMAGAMDTAVKPAAMRMVCKVDGLQ